ncbi:macrophage mannose receptor 1-like [Toxotes jaculatrix]|uniref:macrophage mannose receptor 1-like n=1 Tax=Toxotes jaculatrix TaxID=941984 RepID=UPI001B3B036B|nr:macrophage mannose receptor 1-like [Toxotes jaculatrix]
MKMLTVSLLVCAMMALSRAAADPEEEPGNMAERSVEAVPEEEPGNVTEASAQEENSHLVKRSTRCPHGWTRYGRRCFYYFPTTRTWAQAEKTCQSMNANLASVHNIQEYHKIQRMIQSRTHEYKEAWIGGSDAQEEGTWLWSDGSRLNYLNWCSGQPDNFFSQHCLKMNYSGHKCWDDDWCDYRRPFVCARKIFFLFCRCDAAEHLHTGRLKLQADTERKEGEKILQQITIIFDPSIISTMKMLTVSLLVCAMMALSRAAADPEEEPGNMAERSVEAVPEEEPGNVTEASAQEENSHLVKRSTRCPCGWTQYGRRCFRYDPRTLPWAYAEKTCLSLKANLASVRNIYEYRVIQNMIWSSARSHRAAWIGGSDAQQERIWLWSDGSRFTYAYWCPGQPDNFRNRQHCLQMNFSSRRCMDDYNCHARLPFVCARKM